MLNSCGDNGTNPSTEQPKDPREMTWTADTIAYEGSSQTLMTSMWASSPNDVWIAGHNDRSRGEIYHFDGKIWKEIDPMNDVPRSTKSINKIMGLAPNNIWMVGDRRGYSRKDLIINWDGTKWREHNLNLQVRPISLFANRNDDIWVGCDSAVIYHYNGTTWEKDIPKLNIPQGSEYFINGLVVKENTVYLNVAVYDIKGRRYIFYFVKGRMMNWTVLDSMYQENPSSIIKWGNRGLALGKEGNIYSFGDWGLWIYSNNTWQRTIPINYTMLSVYELNENYKIAVGVYGIVWFYDGTIWKQLERFFTPNGDVHVYDAWTDGQEVFLLGYTSGAWPQKTIVWRGK
jgi:gamma-glutamylcyclotransferase (GGCT)/AIG2-like uncharacterized protein YtfP